MNQVRLIVCLLLALCIGSVHGIDYSLYFVAWRGKESPKWMANIIEKGVQGGVTVVQLDEPTLDFKTYVAFAKDVKKRIKPFGVPLMIKNRIDVAKEAGADGVHFMSYNPAVFRAAKKILGDGAIVGFSAHSYEEIAENTIADYISFGPIFPSKSHPELTPWGVEGLMKARSLTQKFLVACGGVRHTNATDAISAGADGVVVVSSIQNAPDPAAAARDYQTLIAGAR